ISIIAVGKKVKDYSLKRNYDVKSIYSQLSPELMFDKAKEISENIVEYFYTDIFDEVYMIYNHFISAINYELRAEKIIPIPRIESEENINYIFEPTANKVLSTLLPKYLNIIIFQALLNNTASEHSARKNAMKNATDNAEEMIKALNLQYNRERQAAITQEISEIVGGASAMK
ncbi:MAG: F0F1 ATP synthase subunit gamma, partial [Fusobacteriaceae bacterium]